MARIEVTRTLVKSVPELWSDLESGRLSEVLGEVTTHPEEHERRLAWEGEGVRGTAVLEPSGWGTQVTLTAEAVEAVTEIEEAVARAGIWSRLKARRPQSPDPAADAEGDADLEERLRHLLDDLGMAHRRPYVGQ